MGAVPVAELSGLQSIYAMLLITPDQSIHISPGHAQRGLQVRSGDFLTKIGVDGVGFVLLRSKPLHLHFACAHSLSPHSPITGIGRGRVSFRTGGDVSFGNSAYIHTI